MGNATASRRFHVRNMEAGLDMSAQRPVRYESRLKGSFKETEDTVHQTAKTNYDSRGVYGVGKLSK